MKRNILAGMAAVLLLAACQTPAPMDNHVTQDLKFYGVSLQITGGKLKATSKPQGWNNRNRKNGYVGFDQGESGWVFFQLKKEDAGDSCAAAGAGGTADWVITELHLSAYPETVSADEKGERFGTAQPAWLKEAFPDVDLATGQVFMADKKSGVTFLPLQNANGQEGERFIYYRISVEECDGPGRYTLDPGLSNGGRR